MARASVKDKLNTEKTITDSLYSSGPVTIPTQTPETDSTTRSEKTKTAAINNPELVRKTYYYTNDLIKAISIVAALQGKDKSQLVREILMESELIKEYIEKIKTL